MFSTGSQNHQPPHPSSEYAHYEPKTIPPVKKNHEIFDQINISLNNFSEKFLFTSICADITKGIIKPIYPRNNVCGLITNKKCCKIGFRPKPRTFSFAST